MSELLRSYKVFMASPGDVLEERAFVREVCEEINRDPLTEKYALQFQAVGWEDVFPSPGRPQEIINRLVKECDIFVCILHRRFGSLIGKEESGTFLSYHQQHSWLL